MKNNSYTLLIYLCLVFMVRLNAQNVVPGSLPGELSVAASGAAVYTIPIDLPPGRGGLTPQLALQYNSQGETGVLGKGWGISGWSFVERVGKTLYHDNVSEPGSVNFVDDEFSLNGNRFIVVNQNDKLYRFENDDITRITRPNISNPKTEDKRNNYFWKIQSTDGQIKEFGNTSESRQDNGASTLPIRWHLNKITDILGNKIEYEYWKRQEYGEIYLESIKYSPYEVVFEYEDLPVLEYSTSYFSHGPVPYLYSVKKKLISISVIYEAKTLKKYSMEYEYEGILQSGFLKKVTLYDKDGNSIKPTFFDWQYNTPELEDGTSNFYQSHFDHYYTLFKNNVGDFDGDGKSDIVESRQLENATKVFLSNGSQYNIPYPGNIHVGDFDGNGADEIVITGTGQQKKTRVYSLIEGGFIHCGPERDNLEVLFVGDFTGNGLADIITKETGTHYIYPGQPDLQLMLTLSNRKVVNNYPDNIYRTGNFYGNGQLGLLEVNASIVRHYTLVKDGNNFKFFNRVADGYYPIPFSPIRLEVGDFNGDGKDDLITAHYVGSSVKTTIHYGFGSGFTMSSSLTVTQPWWQNKVVVADLNNDGISDMYFHKEEIDYMQNKYKFIYTKLFKYTATDKGFSSHSGDFYMLIPPDVFDSEQEIPILSGDFNGNGERDILYQYEVFYGDPRDEMGDVRKVQSYRHVFYFPKKTMPEDRITQITNGLGMNKRISYKAYDPSSYQQQYAYPVMKYRYPFSTVHTIETQMPNSKEYFPPTTYKYAGMQVHAQGKGMLGFQKTKVLDVATNTETTTSNNLLIKNVAGKAHYFHPFVSTVITTDTKTNKILNHTDIQMDVKNLANGKPLIFLPVATRITTETKDNNSKNSLVSRTVALQSTNDIDAYGNSTKRVERATFWDWQIDPSQKWMFNDSMRANFLPPSADKWIILPDWTETYKFSAEDNYKILIDRIEFTYNSNKLPETKYVMPGGRAGDLSVKETYLYDDYGNIVSLKLEAPQNAEIEARETDFVYDASKRFVEKKTIYTKTDSNLVTEYGYYPNLGLLRWEKDIRENTTEYVYDGFGNLKETHYPDGTSNHSKIEWADHKYAPKTATFQVTSFKQVNRDAWHETTVFFDLMGRELRRLSYNLQGQPVAIEKVYDEVGRLFRVSEPFDANISPNNFTTYTYDHLGRSKEVTLPDGTISETTYNGRTIRTTNKATNVWTEKISNAIGLTDFIKDPTGQINYDYNGRGQLIQVDALGQITKIEYDNAGNQNKLVDPNAGTLLYTYNAFGELVSQTDANLNTYDLKYDDLGRLIGKESRVGGDITNISYYTNSRSSGFGLLKNIVRNDVTNIEYTYDLLGRISEKTETIEQKSFTFAYGYNKSSGMLETYEYPSGYKLKYLYNDRGNQNEIHNAITNALLWEGIEENQRGQYIFTKVGDHTTINWRYDQYGFPRTHKVTKSAGKERTEIMGLAYFFDSVTGNLTERFDTLRGFKETFTYDTDKLHSRLTGWKVNGQTVASLVYGDNGNITKKSDVSTASNSYKYQHPQGKPHAVTAVSSPTVEFQQNALNQNLSFTPFNKVSLISNAYDPNFKLEFTYGHDDQRSMTKLYRTSPTKPDLIKFFTDNYEYEIGTIGLNRHLHYLNGPDGLFAIMVKEGTTETMYYVHKDYLGSISAITDAQGNLVESLSYDPWGRRRNPNNWTDYNISSTLFDRGFTGHEHLPQFGLINMNGRVYDPFLARFLSPDPFVQAPDYSQNFNRYSYAFNNPLKYTDPDGEWVHIAIGAAIGGIVNWAVNGAQFNAKGLGYFGVGALAGGLSAGIGAGFGTLAAGSGSFGFMSATGLTAAGFGPGAAAGAGAGFTSGFVTGTGNSLMQGEKLKQSLGKGLHSGAIGMAIGGLTGGIQGGIRAARMGNDFWSGGPTIHKKLDILWEKARLSGVIEPIDQAVGDVRIGSNSELDGALARARYGKRMPITEFREVNGINYPKVATAENDILFSRRLVRQMWRGASPLEAINHEVIHTSDMFNAAYWNSPHFETLISDYSQTALNAWMEVRAYSINVQRSNWSLFRLNLIRYQNILNSYGIH